MRTSYGVRRADGKWLRIRLNGPNEWTGEAQHISSHRREAERIASRVPFWGPPYLEAEAVPLHNQGAAPDG